MTKQKTTKRTLLTSVLSLILCMAMFIGTTFAWFTDSVASGKNTITAGNLDIELEYYDGSAWKTVDSATELFTGNLWEPGHTEVVYLKLTNKGTLALNYQLGINIASETAGTNVEGNSFKLSNYLNFGVIEGINGETGAYADRATAIEAIPSVNALSAGYTTKGSMEKGADALYMALVVYMPETIGNEANYKTGTAAPTIDLGVNLLATQRASEEDSFGFDYDDNAQPILISSVSEMVSYLNKLASKRSATSKVTNVVFNATGANIGNLSYAFTKTNVPEGMTVVLQDAVISGTNYGNATNGTVIFEDCSFSNGTKGAYDIHFDAGTGNVVFKNCNLNGWTSFGSTLSSIKMINCNITSNNQYGIVRSYSDIVLEDCTIDFSTADATDDYSEGLETRNGATMTINNCTNVNGSIVSICNDNGNGTIVIDGKELSEYTVIEIKEGQTPDEALAAAITAGVTDIVLPAGTYTIDNAAGLSEELTISGTLDTVIAVENESSSEGCDYGLRGSTVTFDGITITTTGDTYNGYAGLTATYNNCVINNTYTLYGDSVFNNCTLNVSGNSYNIWTWGAPSATFNNCTFNCDGKAMLLYGQVNTVLTLNDCVFNDNGDGTVSGKAAIETGDDYSKSYTLIINNIKVNGFDVTTQKNPNRGGTNLGTNVWGNKNLMTADNLDVIIDGVEVY